MLPFLIYALTGVVTACHVFYLLLLSSFGVTQSPVEYLVLALSACLVLCSYISLFKPITAGRITLIISLCMWCFYGPAIVGTLRTSREQGFPVVQVAALPYVAVFMLLITTIYSLVVSFKKAKTGGSWLFPAKAGIASRVVVGILTLLLAVAVAWLAHGAHPGHTTSAEIDAKRPDSKFLIPDGYVGWVHIDFLVPNAPATPVENDQYVFHIGADGKLSTSSAERFGWANDEYFYAAAAGPKELATSARDGRMIWGKINGEKGEGEERRQYEEFFVGNEQQFRALAGSATSGATPSK